MRRNFCESKIELLHAIEQQFFRRRIRERRYEKKYREEREVLIP